jgi:hypothetical protein
MAGKFLRAVGYLIAGLLFLEIAFRAVLFVVHPERFASLRLNDYSVFDRSMWRYDQRFGYDYVPSVIVNASNISNGQVVGCSTSTPVNAQGNIGPAVPDYDTADLKIALFGDSFSATAVDGVTWPSVLQDKLEQATGKKVRVLNLARDGYGVMSMFDGAAVKIPEFKPDLVIFAFQSGDLHDARTWRTVMGTGDDVRLVTTPENSPNPPDADATDIELLAPSATHEWCEAMRQRRNQDDPVLRQILAKAPLLSRARVRADIFDLTSSYLFDRLVRRDSFASQWGKLGPGTNPLLKITDYHLDSGFMRSAQAVMASGVPYLMVHLPTGSDLSEHHEFLQMPGTGELVQNLEAVMHQPVIRMTPYLDIPPADGMKMCVAPSNCHPSHFGMEVYSSAVQKIVLERVK